MGSGLLHTYVFLLTPKVSLKLTETFYCGVTGHILRRINLMPVILIRKVVAIEYESVVFAV